jgi:hypothetical protein
MDLILILMGMSLGATIGWGLASVIAEQSAELRAALSVLGAMFGALGGYAFAWLIKMLQLPARPASAQPRHFRPQVVGSPCAICGERILMIVDAEVCPGCQRVLCKKCVSSVPCPQCRAGAKIVTAEIVEAIVLEEPTEDEGKG